MNVRFVLLLVVPCLSAPLAAQQAAPRDPRRAAVTSCPAKTDATSSAIDLKDGTLVSLRVPQRISSEHIKKGEAIQLVAAHDVCLGDMVVIAEGAIAQAVIERVHRRARVSMDGEITMRIDSVSLVNGQEIPLRAVQKAGHGRKGEVAMATALYAMSPAMVLFPWMLPMLFTIPFDKGEAAEIAAGTEIVAFVHGNQSLQPDQFRLPRIVFSSNPSGAEVTIGDAKIGVTPITRVLAPGDHLIKMSRTGYQPWERTLTAIGGKVSVSAELEARPAP
jgi:hypothetical protein